MKRRLIVVCNALDDATRLERGITTDSPAASRKVLMMCSALRRTGVRPLVLSLGRGRQDGSGRWFRPTVRRVQGVPVLYAALWQRQLGSQLLSLVSPAALLWHLRRLPGRQTVLFYNRMPAYLPTLLLSSLLGRRNVLDLEDGEVSGRRGLAGMLEAGLQRLFDRLCGGGALLACEALSSMTRTRPVLCYYGTTNSHVEASQPWGPGAVAALIGGTVSPDTGAHLLVEAIAQLRNEAPSWAERLHVVVTGKGESIPALSELARAPGVPRVTVHGRTTDAQYKDILLHAQIGLALKPRQGALAHTTFPSKVIELASAGLLVLTTDISDVRQVLGAQGAVYLHDESPQGLIECLRSIVLDAAAAQQRARQGQAQVLQRCHPSQAGSALSAFLFEAKS